MRRQTKEYAKKLVAQMTVEEKMSQMLYESPAIERLNIPAYNWWNEALHGVARAGVWKQNSPAGYERLMEVRIRLGMMKDYPSPYEDITYDKVECPEHVKLSVEAARRSLVLLKNENAFLPLDKNKIQTVAVSSRMQEVQNLPEVTWLRWWSAERVRRHRLSISVQKYQETILNIVSYML